MTLDELRELAKRELALLEPHRADLVRMGQAQGNLDRTARAVLAMADVVEVEAELHPPEARHNKSCSVCQAMVDFDKFLEDATHAR